MIQEKCLPELRAHCWTLYHLCRQIKARTIIELGVRSGDSTRCFLAAAEDTDGKVFSYDIAGDAYHVRKVTEDFGIPWVDRWECQQADSVEAAKFWGEWTADFVFVDTVHSLEQTMAEIKAWTPIVRPGGIIAFHDTAIPEPGRDGVLPAIKNFLWLYGKDGWSFEEHHGTIAGDTGIGILYKKELQ